MAQVKRLRPHLTYANTVSTLALFLVLTGGSALAAKSFIDGASIRNGSIPGAKLKTGAVGTKQLKNGSITEADISPSTLAKLNGSPGAPGVKGDSGGAGPTGPTGTFENVCGPQQVLSWVTPSVSHGGSPIGDTTFRIARCVGNPSRTAASGDGILDPTQGEQCDDANMFNGDGCSYTGLFEHPGQYTIEGF
jgi:cysteine-rich repeat protein